MIWQKLKQTRFVDISHLMKFDALRIIHIEIFFLSYSKHVFILQKMDVSDELFGLEFANELLIFPVKHSDMSFLGSHENMFTI